MCLMADSDGILSTLTCRDGVDPFTQGVDAAAACCSFFNCPYEPNTAANGVSDQFLRWHRGFNIVRRRQIDDALKASGRKTLRQWAA